MRLQLSPILIKEMRSTMRGGRTFIGITLFLIFLAGVSLLVYYAVAQDNFAPNAARAGQTIFIAVGIMEALMLAVVAPPLTSGAIASERQKQTFDMLMATPLTPAQVLRGKLFASMNYLFLLMLAGLPINAIVFLFGGVPPTALFWWVALVGVVLLLLGSLGLFMSTVFKSNGVATALTYLLCILLFVIVPIGMLFTTIVFGTTSTIAECTAVSLGLLHPAGSLASIFVDEVDFNAAALLPATLPLYGALAGLLFFAAEARLSSLAARRWRRVLPATLLLLVVVMAVLYIVSGPVMDICQR